MLSHKSNKQVLFGQLKQYHFIISKAFLGSKLLYQNVYLHRPELYESMTLSRTLTPHSAGDSGMEESDDAMVPAETLCEQLRRAFRLTTEKFNQYENIVASQLEKKSPQKVTQRNRLSYEPLHVKTNNVVSGCLTQTGLKSHRGRLEAENFLFRKQRNYTIHVAKTNALISFSVTAKLICAFVFAYAKCCFSHDTAHM